MKDLLIYAVSIFVILFLFIFFVLPAFLSYDPFAYGNKYIMGQSKIAFILLYVLIMFFIIKNHKK